MQIIIPITEWQTKKVTRGRTAGKELSSRYVLAVDNYNWIIALDSKDAVLVGQKFVPSMTILYRYLQEFADNANARLEQLNVFLANKLKKDRFILKTISQKTLANMDEHYQINFNLHEDVIQKFK